MEKLVPKLRFPEFNGNWESKKLSELDLNVIDGDRGKNYPSSNEFSEIGYCLFLNAKNVTKNGFSFENNMFISKEKDNDLNKGKLKRNDLVLTTRGSVGNIALFNNEVVYENIRINSGMVILRNKNSQVDSNFIYKYFLTPHLVKQINQISFGSAQPQLTVKVIREFKLIIPSLPEQQKIASFLTSVDERLTLLAQQKEKLELYKKGVMQQIFSQKLRFKPDLSGVKGDENGNNFPDWEEKKLGDVGTFISGVGFSNSEQGGKIGIPFLKVSDMNILGNEFYIKHANNYVVHEQINRLKYKPIVKDSIIFAKVGAAIFLERKRIASNFLLDNNMMAYIPKGIILFYKYIFDTLRLSKYSQTGALPSYNSGNLKSIKIKVPCIEEQQKIASFLSAIDVQIEGVSKKIEQTKTFKKGLLQQMFV